MDLQLLVENRGLEHLALHIFGSLDIGSILECRAVNSSWKYLIDNSLTFWQKLLHESPSIFNQELVNLSIWKEMCLNHFYQSCEDLRIILCFILQIFKREGIDFRGIDTAFSLACKYGPLPLIKIFLRSSQNDKVKEPWTLEITEYTIPGLNAEEIEELEELEFLERRTLRKRRIVRKNIFVDMCGSGRVELVSSLMDDIEKFGINVNEPDNNGLTADDIAWTKEHCDLLKFLCENRIKIGLHTLFTPPHTSTVRSRRFIDACSEGKTALVMLSLEHSSELGIDINVRTQGNGTGGTGLNCLMEACYQRHLDIVKILLQYHKKIDMKFTYNGLTLIHFVVRLVETLYESSQLFLEILEYILQFSLENDIDMNMINEWGETPYEFVQNLGPSEEKNKLLLMIQKYDIPLLAQMD